MLLSRAKCFFFGHRLKHMRHGEWACQRCGKRFVSHFQQGLMAWLKCLIGGHSIHWLMYHRWICFRCGREFTDGPY